jgi:hypothetical protein
MALATTAMTAPGCAGDECVEVSTDCTPLYEPTFDNIYANTLLQRCAVGGGSCHLAGGNQGGLSLPDADAAYDALVGGGDNARVIGGDPSCSLLLSRLAAPDDGDVMPPGARLADNELCAIAQWVDDGAKR